jgi:Domain of unknown function (DUF4168)
MIKREAARERRAIASSMRSVFAVEFQCAFYRARSSASAGTVFRDIAYLQRCLFFASRGEARKIGENTMRLWSQILTAAVLATAVPVANAQVPSPAPSPSQPSQNIPDQKLDATAAALNKIADVKQSYTQQIEASASESDKQRLVDEANKELVKAVTDQGLSVEEYTSIMVVAQNDPAVRQKIIQRMRPTNK